VGGAKRGGGGGTLTLIVTALVVMALFTFGYRLGKSSQAKTGDVEVSAASGRLKTVQTHTDRCVKDRKQVSLAKSNRDEDVQRLTREVDHLNSEATRLNAQHGVFEQESTDCLETQQLRKAAYDSTDAANRKNITDLQLKTHVLIDMTKRLMMGKGIDETLLLQALSATRQRMMRLRHEAGLEAPAAGSTAALLKKWNRTSAGDAGTSDADVLGIAIGRRVRTIDPSLKDFLNSTSANWTKFAYSAAAYPAVFMTTPATDDGSKRPAYFNRTGDASLAVGVALQRHMPLFTLPTAVKATTAFALCALRANNSDFTFVDAARVRSKTARKHEEVHLQTLIDTPLVRFCTKCKHMLYSTAFKLACGPHKVERHYGGYDYWAARSMVRFQPKVLRAARALWANMTGNMTGERVLGVSFFQYLTDSRACKRAHQRMPGLHYRWVTNNFPNGTAIEGSKADVDRQCGPSEDDMTSLVARVVAAAPADQKPTVLFVGVNTISEMSSLRLIDFGDLRLVVHLARNAEQDAVELAMMSFADQIIVNRFSDNGLVTTEAFLLNHNLDAKNRVHFF
jgi:hypothetical protein